MQRAALFLLLVLAGCNRDPGAIQALITYDSTVRASCLALDVLSSDGAVLESQRLERPFDRTTLKVAVFRGGLPEQVQFQVRALWARRGCEEPLMPNGKTPLAVGQFEPKKIGLVTLDLQPPSAAQDADHDGFIDEAQGGADCNDQQQERRPGAQEVCDASDDFNCDQRYGCEDPTCAAPSCSFRPVALSVSTSTPLAPAGDCVQVTVRRLGADGQPTKANLPTPLNLDKTLPEGASFYANAVCTDSLTSAPAIAPGASEFVFFVQGARAGRGELIATATTIDARASLPHEIIAGPGTKPRFTTEGARTVLAGDCTPFTVSWLDRYNNPALGQPKNITASGATPTLFHDEACQQAVPKDFSFPAASTLTVYMRNTKVGTATVSVEGQDEKKDQSATVRGAVPSKLVFTDTTAQVLLAGECSRPVPVSFRDMYDNPTSPFSATQLTLEPELATVGLSFYPESGCTGTPLTTLPVAAGAPEARFRFKGKTGGPVTLKASLPGPLVATQEHTVTPAVRRGECRIDNGKSTATCGITPNLRDLSKSFVVFQATNASASPRDAFVQCQLKTDQLACGRVGTMDNTRIQWQVVELPTGVKVQHQPAKCTDATRNTVSVGIESVSRDKSFILLSSSQDGASTGSNDFVGVQFNGREQVDIKLKDGCNNHTFSVQVVEWENATAQTDQGVTAALSGTSLPVTGLPAVPDLARTVLLSNSQADRERGDNICNRMVRGQLDSATAMSFSLAAGSTSCLASEVTAISWQRITFPQGTVVHAATVTADNLIGKVGSTLPTPVDTTRTLLMTSSQAHGGQGSGESAHTSTDAPGVATARLWLSSNQQLELERDFAADRARWTAYAIQLDP